jgi:hypothetical protein
MCKRIAIILTGLAVMLTGCTHTQQGVEIRTVERVVEVQKPCPVVKPERPATVNKTDIPKQAQDAVLYLYAALMGWQGAGMYGDKADAAIDVCLTD